MKRLEDLKHKNLPHADKIDEDVEQQRRHHSAKTKGTCKFTNMDFF
jgi:hypothetical protein